MVRHEQVSKLRHLIYMRNTAPDYLEGAVFEDSINYMAKEVIDENGFAYWQAIRKEAEQYV